MAKRLSTRPNVPAAGYVIQKRDKNIFLSGGKRFIKHRNHGARLGINRAYVHSLTDVVKGGKWADDDLLVHPARYNPKSEVMPTELVGFTGRRYRDFINSYIMMSMTLQQNTVTVDNI